MEDAPVLIVVHPVLTRGIIQRETLFLHKASSGGVRRLKLGNRGKLAVYLTTWALIGVILLSIPTLVSPFAEKALTTPNPSYLTTQRSTGANTTTTSYPVTISGANSSLAFTDAINRTVSIQSSSATNITIHLYSGNPNAITITSTSPANITVTSRQPGPSAASAPLSNIPDFALRLSLVLVPAVALSSLGLVRVRRRFRREFEDAAIAS